MYIHVDHICKFLYFSQNTASFVDEPEESDVEALHHPCGQGVWHWRA